MKHALLVAAATLALATSPTIAHASVMGADILIVNNGDGSDLLASITRWMGWLRL